MNAPWCLCGGKRNGFIPDPNTPRLPGPEIGGLATDKGWWVCSNCLKPTIQTLNDCDTCERKFKGIRPGIKVAYTCPDCDG